MKNVIKTALTTVTVLALSGCYFVTQGTELFKYYNRAKPIEKVLKGDISPEAREFLFRVQDIRSFAIDELGLKENKNYSVYAEIDRDFLAYVVSASPKDRFEHYYWNYPFLGEMPYQGFFHQKDAEKEALRLKEENLDVWVRQVDAFSTLGILTDPLFSYMMDYTPYQLANLLIHEQTHATIWVKNHSDFNEQLATFIGDQGARLYILKTYGEESVEYQSIDWVKQDQETFRLKLFGLRDQLNLLYNESSWKSPDLYREKEQVIRDFQARFLEEYEQDFKTENYRGLGTIAINNAFINLYSLYMADFAPFEEFYRESNQNLVTFIHRINQINRRHKDPFSWMKTGWTEVEQTR